jgi:hypothetical protein
MNQSNEYLSEFPKLSHMFLYKGNELADFLNSFLGQMRAFLREVDYYKEKLLMNQFYEKNGFAANDDDAKRALIDELCQETSSCPTTDQERNELVHTNHPTEWTDMMRIGWRPKY